MSVSRIATRYAKSLIDLAVEQNKLDRIVEDIKAFQKATKNRDLFLMLKSPIINPTKKAQVLKAVFGPSFDEMTMAFFKIVVNKNRESALPDIAEEFMEQYKKIKHITTVHLTTASPMGAEVISKIKQKLVASSATDDNVEIVTKVNPELLGGFILEIEDNRYDASVTHQLDRLKKQFMNNDYIKN